MNINYLLNAAAPIPLHAIMALLSLILGTVQLMRPKFGVSHKVLGYGWIFVFGITLATSFFIFSLKQIGPFSWIHLLSIMSTVALIQGWRMARQRRFSIHKSIMTQLFIGALGINLWFTFLPGRVMHEVMFGPY